MSNFPDHPVIRAMQRDGCLPDRHGYVCRCHACGAAIYPKEKYYQADDKPFCEDHGIQALEEITRYATF